MGGLCPLIRFDPLVIRLVITFEYTNYYLIMKKILLIAAVFISYHANAQYYEHIYGNTGIDNLSDGLTPQVGAAGYFMVGVSNNAGPGHLLAVRSDQSGWTAGTGYYTKDFTINNNGFPSVDLEVNQAKCIERSSLDPNLNGMMAVVGSWVKPGTSQKGLFYCEIHSGGGMNYGPINIYDALGAYQLHLGSVTRGTLANGNPEALYITGWANNNNGVRNVIVIKYDMQTHTIVWDRMYSIAPPKAKANTEGYDIIEDPNTTNRILVVGEIEDSRGDKDAFIMTVDGNNGNASQFDIFGTLGKADYFTSISPAHNPDGFIIGGVTQKNNPNDMWALKVDNALGIVWSTTRDYNNGFIGTNQERSANIIERLNTSARYEYYQVGDAFPGILGGADVVVYKLDINGWGLAGGQFTYGNAGNDAGEMIDFANPNTDGIIAMGTYEDPLNSFERDFYTIRAYFNGETSHSCNFDLRSPTASLNGPIAINSSTMLWSSLVSTSNYVYFDNGGLNSTEFCFDNTVFGGINARVAPTETGDKEGVMVSPNPMAQGSVTANISIDAKVAEQVTVKVYDMVGRQCYNQQFTMLEGENVFTLDFSSVNMAQGMYSVQIRGVETAKTVMLMVK